MYHFVYKTVNTKNGKFYIGKHSTENLNDGYFGSGPELLRAVNKHGLDMFETWILELFDTEEAAIRREREIVTREFCDRDDTYNVRAANQAFTWTGKDRPDQAEVMKRNQPWLKKKKPQLGIHNPTFGTVAHNAKQVQLHNKLTGETREFSSLQQAADFLGMARQNARKIMQGKAKSRRGWIITQL